MTGIECVNPGIRNGTRASDNMETGAHQNIVVDKLESVGYKRVF